MPTIKNIGKQQRMVVDRFLQPGDSRFISAKRVDSFKGDPDYEIVDETPKGSGEQLAVSDQPEAKSALLKVQVEVIEPELSVISPQPEVAVVQKPTKKHQVIKVKSESKPVVRTKGKRA